jgi:hypothetical protein
LPQIYTSAKAKEGCLSSIGSLMAISHPFIATLKNWALIVGHPERQSL